MNFDQLRNAIKRFEEMLAAFKAMPADSTTLEHDAFQDSLVKRFEYTLEVSWKSCKRYLFEEGFLEAAAGSPKSIMRLAAEAGMIRNAENWIQYINARQSTSHDHFAENTDAVLSVVDGFSRDVIGLYERMSGTGY